MGWCAILEGFEQEAKAPAKKLIELYPEFVGSGNGYAYLARACRNLEETEEERGALREWAKRDGDAADAFTRLIDFAKGFDPVRLNDAISRTEAGFRHLNDLLSDGREYLDGNAFSLSDIAWMPNVHRFSLMDWPFERTPHLAAWFERIKTRPSYHDALVNWQDPEFIELLQSYTTHRQAEATDIRSFPHFADQ